MEESQVDLFMEKALESAGLSSDLETKVGSVAVNPETLDFVLPSCNSFISGTTSDLPNTRPEKYEYILHAEVNMVCQAAQTGTSLKGYWSIQTLSPCHNCIRTLWQSGIRTVVFKDAYRDFQNQILMKDVEIKVSSLGKYTKLELSPKLS